MLSSWQDKASFNVSLGSLNTPRIIGYWIRRGEKKEKKKKPGKDLTILFFFCAKLRAICNGWKQVSVGFTFGLSCTATRMHCFSFRHLGGFYSHESPCSVIYWVRALLLISLEPGTWLQIVQHVAWLSACTSLLLAPEGSEGMTLLFCSGEHLTPLGCIVNGFRGMPRPSCSLDRSGQQSYAA